MTENRISPGPAASSAFQYGILAGIVLGLTGVGLLYRSGYLTPAVVWYVLLALFPTYLVLVASLLSKWLGYDRDGASLRPVYRDQTE